MQHPQHNNDLMQYMTDGQNGKHTTKVEQVQYGSLGAVERIYTNAHKSGRN